jgi:hypothetical protein
MRLTVLLALLGFLVAGCDKSPVGVAPTPTQKKAWIGSYSGVSGPGDMVLDLAQTGSAFTGGIVFGSPDRYLRVSGAADSDSVFLTLDPKYSSNPSDFSLRAQVLTDGSLSGTMSLASSGFNADLTCRALARRTIDTDRIHNIPFAVFGMVYDGGRLWLSTLSNYVRMNPDGTFADTIVIYHDPLPAHWTSDVVMYDGALLWGVYGITIIGPGGTTNVADLLAFTAGGRTPDSLRIEHRPLGLAHDGAHSWSLRDDPPALLQFDGAGAVTDSLHLGIPDAYRLVFDGVRFWTLGWNLERLYEVNLDGQVLAICDLPGSDFGGLPAGLAVEGSYVWFAEAGIGASRLHRMTVR